MPNASIAAAVRTIPQKVLAMRSGAVRTFAGPAFLFAVTLLLAGGYLVEEQFTSPLASQSFALFAGAFFIAMAITILIELFHVPKRNRRGCADLRSHVAVRDWQIMDAARHTDPSRSNQRRDLPYHRCYVDRVRVRA
jgi:hypothetical protein